MRKIKIYLISAYVFLSLCVALTIFIFGETKREVARFEERQEYVLRELGEMCARGAYRIGYDGENFYALCK